MVDERTYIRVHDGMPDHPKVEALSDKAFRLLVERWCWCSRHRTDGKIPRAVWLKSGTPKARRELVDGGLVEVHEDHIQMHDYLEHQRSAAEIADLVEAKRRAGVLGNHNRWHVPQSRHDPSCPLCTQSQMRSQVRSQKASRSDRKTSPETETDTDHLLGTKTGEGHPGQRATDEPPNRCPKHRDTPADGPCPSCGDYRRDHEKWRAEQPQRQGAQRHADARRAAELRAIAAMNCDLCDDDGYRGTVICDHDPEGLARAARGRAAVQNALTRKDPA